MGFFKKTLDVFNNRVDSAKEKISELKYYPEGNSGESIKTNRL